MKTIELSQSRQHPVYLSERYIQATVYITYNFREMEVVGQYDIITKEFDPLLVGVFSIDQFLTENNLNKQEFRNKITKLFAKNIYA